MCRKKDFNTLTCALERWKVRYSDSATFAELTTLGVGGKIRLTAFPDSIGKTVKLLRLADKLGIERVVLGKGSNVLASDDAFDGLAVVMRQSDIAIRGRFVTALAGTSTVHLANVLQTKGLAGGEFLACLPATVGGAVVGNAGCFGQDIRSVLHSVTVYKDGRVRRIGAKKCGFSKRNSIFKKQSDWVVLSAKFKFVPSDSKSVANNIAQMRSAKARSQPLKFRSAGCVVYHDSVSLSPLIDQVGLKGYRVGGAQISTKHAGFVLNIDKATALDIYLVIQHIKETLWDKFGLTAKTEVRLIGWQDDDILPKRQT